MATGSTAVRSTPSNASLTPQASTGGRLSAWVPQGLQPGYRPFAQPSNCLFRVSSISRRARENLRVKMGAGRARPLPGFAPTPRGILLRLQPLHIVPSCIRLRRSGDCLQQLGGVVQRLLIAHVVAQSDVYMRHTSLLDHETSPEVRCPGPPHHAGAVIAAMHHELTDPVPW
jgi:hypothetical protein